MLRQRLATITNPRHTRGRVHPLAGVLTLTVLGLMAGCRSMSAIHRWGELQPELWEPLTGRAQRVNACPSALLTTSPQL